MTYPVVTRDIGSAFLSECPKDGRCQIGAQLHPWVTPPFDEIVNPHNSFACNLPPSSEFAKPKTLTEALSKRFGVRPATYRAGRYGIGPNTVKALSASTAALCRNTATITRASSIVRLFEHAVLAGFGTSSVGIAIDVGRCWPSHRKSGPHVEADKRCLERTISSLLCEPSWRVPA